jgi:hypothetical protein
MNNSRELKDMRELNVDELDVVSGGGWLRDLVSVVAIGVGGAYLASKANGGTGVH